MPLEAAAVCPHPPLLVPQFAAGTAARSAVGAAGGPGDDLAPLRSACREAVILLLGSAPDVIVVVGTGPTTATYPGGTRTTLAAWGVDVPVGLGAPNGRFSDAAAVDLPLSLAIGGWLLGAPPRPVRGLAVAPDLSPDDYVDLGRTVAEGHERVALLVMADGSVCRSVKAPGYLDERAAPFDARISRALSLGDVAALLQVDATLAADLGCAGYGPLQVLAGAAALAAPPRRRLHYDDAPYGVGYFVASWT